MKLLLLLISLFSSFSIANCPKESTHVLKMFVELQTIKESKKDYTYELDFYLQKIGNDYNFCLSKLISANGELRRSIQLFSLSEMAKEKISIIDSPVEFRGRYHGLVFLSRKHSDPQNFFGVSYPKQIKVFGSDWGWQSMLIEKDNEYFLTSDVNKNGSYQEIRSLNVNESDILYTEKFGYRKLPIGIKTLNIE